MGAVSRKQYLAATRRLEELINIVDDNTPIDDPLQKNFLKFQILLKNMRAFTIQWKTQISNCVKQNPIKRKQKFSPISPP